MQKSKKFIYTVGAVSALWGVAIVATSVAIAVNSTQAPEIKTSQKALVSQADFSNSSEVRINISDLSSDLLNTELQLVYKEQDSEEQKVKLFTPTNTNEQLTLGGLTKGKVYEYTLQSGTEVITSGTLATTLQPTFALRGTTDKEISFVISNLDAKYLGSTLTVKYALADKPSEQLGVIDMSISQTNKKIGTDYYEILGVIKTQVESNKKYILEVTDKNIAGKLTWTLVADTKDVPTAELIKAYSYSAELAIKNLKTFVEANSKDFQFLILYKKKAAVTANEMLVKLMDVNDQTVTLKNLEPGSEYTAEVYLVKGTERTKLGWPISLTTTGAVTPVAAITTFNKLVSASFENLTHVGAITDLKFAWVAQPESGAPLYLVTNSTTLEADATTTTTGKVKDEAKLKQLKPGTTYVAQIFATADQDFKKPLLATPYKFQTLKPLSVKYDATKKNLTILGLEQLSTKELTFRFNEIVAEGETAGAEITTDNTPSTSESQTIDLASKSLVDGKKYGLTIYMKSDTSKANLLFEQYDFDVPTPAPAAPVPPAVS